MYEYYMEVKMLAWTHEESIPTRATGAQVWALWSRPHEWNRWDEGLEWVTLEGTFVSGTWGRLKPVGGPEVKFVILEAWPERGFTDRALLPLTRLDFIHLYTPGPLPEQGGRVTVRIEMRGVLTPLFKRIIGRDIQKTLSATLDRFAAQAEKVE